MITVLGAKYANEDQTAAIVTTVERGAVAVSERDRPELWARLMEWVAAGNAIESYQAPPEQSAGDIALAQLQKSPALRGLVILLAERFGVTPQQVANAIKERA